MIPRGSSVHPRSAAVIAGSVALAALGAAVLAFGALQAGREPATAADRAVQIAAELRCPDCQALSVADSRSEAAEEIRREIAAQVADGRTSDEIREYFVERYGDWILLTPRSPVTWLVPVSVIAVALVGLTTWLRAARGRRVQSSEAAERANDAYRDRVRADVEALDA